MRIEHLALIVFGIIVLGIGLIASFYVETQTFGTFTVKEYPYRDIGLVLVLAGIIVTTLGFVSFRRSENLISKRI